MHESDSITRIKGVGEKRAELYRSIGIETVGDMLRYFPRDYTDYSLPVPMNELQPEDTAVFAGTVIKKLRP
ncbi:MAG TPA: ATP-dependent DNA helicase RecG, partial [Ruminococcaceae bacterium]|nr:ATP-dependent DNA helicase RecG [Oscillospiraceae bacterium]